MDSTNPCCCCLLRLPENDLKTPYIRLGVTEIFADILEDCFQIQLAVNEEGWGICEVCVNRLRDASDFKLQVQRSQEELRARLESRYVKMHEPIELEISYDNEGMNNEEKVKPDLTSKATVFPESAQPGSSAELATHPNSTKIYKTVFRCDICLSTFGQESTLEKHMKKMHNNFEIQPKIEACDTFEKQYTMFCSSNKHQIQPKSYKRVRGPYTCKTCSDVFCSKKDLCVHQRIHKAKKVHSCEICHKIFKRKYKMVAHVRTHTGQKPFSCEICHKSFTVNSSLTEHKRIHTGDVFICDVCNKQYIRKHELVMHMRLHTGSKPYECEICNKQFTYRTNLDAHRSVHSEEKPYSCDVCGKRFKRKYHMKEHSVGHLGQKPYSCELCNQKFTAKSHVKKHKIKLHPLSV